MSVTPSKAYSAVSRARDKGEASNTCTPNPTHAHSHTPKVEYAKEALTHQNKYAMKRHSCIIKILPKGAPYLRLWTHPEKTNSFHLGIKLLCLGLSSGCQSCIKPARKFSD
eukprot:1105252-Prorocentrum_minimum.AAC.5